LVIELRAEMSRLRTELEQEYVYLFCCPQIYANC
jgi:hypothetical protein